jgi:hypothetical protein
VPEEETIPLEDPVQGDELIFLFLPCNCTIVSLFCFYFCFLLFLFWVSNHFAGNSLRSSS